MLRRERLFRGLKWPAQQFGAAAIVAIAMLAAGVPHALSRDYSLHMTVHVAPQCALTRTTGLIKLYALGDGGYALRRGLGRLHVVCNTPFAVDVRRHTRRVRAPATGIVARHPGLLQAADDKVRVAWNAVTPSGAPVMSDAELPPTIDAAISVTLWRPADTQKNPETQVFRDRWGRREVPQVFSIEVTSRL